MKQKEYDEFKLNTSYLKRVICSAKTSCMFWRKGNFCLFPGEMEVGGMGTCLSMEPPKDFGKM